MISYIEDLIPPSRHGRKLGARIKRHRDPPSARAPITVVLDVDVDGILEISAELFRLFLQQRIPRNH